MSNFNEFLRRDAARRWWLSRVTWLGLLFVLLAAVMGGYIGWRMG